jgi:hypothetical protein
MIRGKSSYSFLSSLVKGQDYSFKDLMGVFCTVGGTLVLFSATGITRSHTLYASLLLLI